MTEEEIKSIATEIANTLYNEDKSYNHHLWWSEEPKERKAEEVEDVIDVLLRDYHIIPKDQARNLARLTFENGGSDDNGLIDGLVDWVCDNFDEEYREECEK